jgi:hypothetical protein
VRVPLVKNVRVFQGEASRGIEDVLERSCVRESVGLCCDGGIWRAPRVRRRA